MGKNREITLALSVMAAVAGAGFSSGREIVLFFGQLGWAAWPGMVLASMLFALMVGLMLQMARKTGAKSFQGVFYQAVGQKCGRGIGILYGLMMALTCAMMLRTCGELGAIALPVRHGYLHAMALAFFLAVAIGTNRMRLLPVLGAGALVWTTVFYTALFMDSREVYTYMRVETVLRLEGSLWAALILALMHACLNASVAAGTVIRFSQGRIRPWQAAAASGGMMLVCLICAHAAIMRGGEKLYAQSLPTVILAARWGIGGFWISTLYMYAMSVCTLSACISSISAQFSDGTKRNRWAVLALPVMFLLFYTFGTDDIIGVGYPVLGWICAMFMIVLACRADEERAAATLCAGRTLPYAKND